MGMDLCYYGVREVNMPEILEGNFFEEDFTNSKPKYILRVFSAKDFFYLYTAGKELEEEDFQGKNERDLFIETFLGETTISFAPEDIYSYCSSKEKVKEIADFLNKINIEDYFKKIGIIEEIAEKNFSGEIFSYSGIRVRRKFSSYEEEEEEYIFDVENTIESFNEFKEFYNELVKNNLGVYISIF